MSNPFEAYTNAAANPVAPAPAVQPSAFAPAASAPAANPFGVAPAAQPPQPSVVAATAPVVGGMMQLPDMSDVGESGRGPGIPEGLSLLEFKSNTVKTFTGHTAIASFTIIQCQDPSLPPGSTTDFVKKLPTDRSKQKTAIGFALSMIRALAGYNDENTFKQAIPYWSQLLAAFIHGDPKFAQWAQGRRVGVRGTRGEAIIDKKDPQRPTGRFYVNLEWFPAPASAPVV